MVVVHSLSEDIGRDMGAIRCMTQLPGVTRVAAACAGAACSGGEGACGGGHCVARMATMAKMLIRNELADDVDGIREVNRLAFGQEAEGRLVDRLREEGYTRVSLVAEIEGRIVAHILFSHLPIVTATGEIPAVALAPMAVVPELQRRGIGSGMVQAGIGACRGARYKAIVVLGHRAFYPRFGFSAELARQIRAPYSGEDFMALQLEPCDLARVRGRVTYPPPFQEV
jgi:putative acetyltransferase